LLLGLVILLQESVFEIVVTTVFGKEVQNPENKFGENWNGGS